MHKASLLTPFSANIINDFPSLHRFPQKEYHSSLRLSVFYKYPSGLSTMKNREIQSSLRAFPVLMIK
ncbi:hypothetical protein HMPREF6123_1371 [Oribacterium sinus F0268]|uniref:Uncharacterized protein n=1 Tax=Oribacterium sinus F0268 TaxID=585501 RepID=C2KY02_9FIRM|nr:hypothetical protein HMPREF6123_1371 [Oribacterium sinus F0268]